MATDLNGATIAACARNGARHSGPAFGLFVAAALLDNVARARANMPGVFYRYELSVTDFAS